MAGDNKTVLCNFGLSALFTSIVNNFSVAAGCSLQLVRPNANVGVYCHDYILNNPWQFLSGLSPKDLLSESSLHGARILLMLGSSYLSAMHILAVLRRS